MTILQTIIAGIVEGLTEFLPISSTGHLLILNNLMGVETTTFATSFTVYIQLGAILAVAVLYVKKLLLSPRKMLLIAAAFLPTALIGYFLYPVIKKVFLTSLPLIGWSLLIGGIVIIIFEYWQAKKINAKTITLQKSFLIGVCQALAVIPGVSRAAATILGGLAMKIDRREIVEFSFLLALPTMAAASGLDMIETGFSFSQHEWILIAIGFVVSFLTALLAIRFLLSYIQKNDFKLFGWYRIVIGLAVLLLL